MIPETLAFDVSDSDPESDTNDRFLAELLDAMMKPIDPATVPNHEAFILPVPPAVQVVPDGFEAVGWDPVTGKIVGWVPVSEDSKEDRWFREAFDGGGRTFADGTYELCGPKVNRNPEGYDVHNLIPHAYADQFPEDPPRTFAGLSAFLPSLTWEGIVWHHPDGRMCKIKRRDFR